MGATPAPCLGDPVEEAAEGVLSRAWQACSLSVHKAHNDNQPASERLAESVCGACFPLVGA